MLYFLTHANQGGSTAVCLLSFVLIHLCKLIKGDLAILVLVHGLAELLDDLTNSISRQRKIGHFKQLIQLICADVAISVQIWTKGKR